LHRPAGYPVHHPDPPRLRIDGGELRDGDDDGVVAALWRAAASAVEIRCATRRRGSAGQSALYRAQPCPIEPGAECDCTGLRGLVRSAIFEQATRHVLRPPDTTGRSEAADIGRDLRGELARVPKL